MKEAESTRLSARHEALLMAKKSQWHPAFVAMLRPAVESHFEVRPTLPVGDTPREADVVLLRRRRAGRLPFTGLWKDLTTWNVLEFKGPTVSPRDEDADLLVELGLGVYRRLNEEAEQEGRTSVPPEQVSFWYLANRIGRRLRRRWEGRELRGLAPHGQGVWRCEVMGRPLYLVSGSELPVEEDCLPLHLIGRETPEKEREVAELVASDPNLWEHYGAWMAAFHDAAYKRVHHMAKTTRKKFEPNFDAVIETMGMDWLINHLGVDRLIEHLGAKQVLKRLNPQQLWEEMTPEQRRAMGRLVQEESARSGGK